MKKLDNYYRLDNAAQIYTASAKKDWNCVFRVGAHLKENVNRALLSQAVIDLAPRFPTFYASLYEGKFYDYLVPIGAYDNVSYEDNTPCRPFDLSDSTKPLFRVLYKDNRISVEFFHSVTDGTGAITYLKTLIARYLTLQGHKIGTGFGVLDITETPSAAETEDAFQRVYDKKRKASRKEADAYQYLPDTRTNKDFFQVTRGYLKVDELKKITKEKYVCTITEYLVAVYCYAYLQQYLRDRNGKKRTTKKPIRISVPANLRSVFESKTLRNFAMFANVDIYPQKREYTFEDVLAEIKAKMQVGLEKENLLNMASQNVSEEKMLITKIAPNFLKKTVMKRCYEMFGERKCTSQLTNLGLQKVPAEMEEHIQRFEFMIGETWLNRQGCGVIATGNEMTVSFTSISPDQTIQNFFFGFMEMEGVCVTAECNI